MTNTGDNPAEQAIRDVYSPPVKQWLTIDQAAETTGLSAQTVRRRIKTETWAAVKRDGRWLIDADTIPTDSEPPAVRRSASSAPLIPLEVLEKMQEAWQQVVAAEARAQVAEARLDFERERRQELERRIVDLEGTPAPVAVSQDAPKKEPERHYELDPATGTVDFGDGEAGAVPPAGEPSIDAQYTPEPEPEEIISDELVREMEEFEARQRPWWRRIRFGRGSR